MSESACRILERPGHKLSDAEVDYEAFAGVHNLIITHAGIRFRVQFAEQTLRRKSLEDQGSLSSSVAGSWTPTICRAAAASATIEVRRVRDKRRTVERKAH
jgi:hypothetical protein